MTQNSNQQDPKCSKIGYSIEQLEILFQFEKLLEFEKLISALAAGFTNLPTERIDQEIERGLKLVAEFLAADRAGILQYSEDHQTVQLTHRYVREGIEPHTHKSFKTEDLFLWYKQALETMGVVVFEDLPEDLPPEAGDLGFIGIFIRSNIHQTPIHYILQVIYVYRRFSINLFYCRIYFLS